MESSSIFWIPYITDWWQHQDETHSKYSPLSNMAHDILSIIPHGVGVGFSFSLGRDVIGWGQSETTGKIRCEKVVVRLFARANNRILTDTDPKFDTTNTENDSEMKQEAEERKLHRMAKVHHFLEMLQGSKNLCATQKESLTQNKQMAAVGIHFGLRRDRQRILVTLPTSWCGCIENVRKITFATSFVRKGPPWRPNSNLECPPYSEKQPSSSRK
jgi:hypothetical protein